MVEMSDVEMLIELLREDGPAPQSRGVVRPDSELTWGVMTGRVSVGENVDLARELRKQWVAVLVRTKFGKRVTLSHIKGHSNHHWC